MITNNQDFRLVTLSGVHFHRYQIREGSDSAFLQVDFWMCPDGDSSPRPRQLSIKVASYAEPSTVVQDFFKKPTPTDYSKVMAIAFEEAWKNIEGKEAPKAIEVCQAIITKMPFDKLPWMVMAKDVFISGEQEACYADNIEDLSRATPEVMAKTLLPVFQHIAKFG